MAEIRDKLVDVKGLGAVYNRIRGMLSGKLDDAKNESKVNQVLTADKWGGWEWKDLPTIPTTNDIRQIVNEQLVKIKGTVKETFVHVDDAFPSTLLGIEIEGACRQDGTPSPDNPVPIEVIEHPVVQVRGRNLLDTELLNDENNFDINQSSSGFWVYEFVTPSTGDYTVSVKRAVRNSGYLMVSDNPKYAAGKRFWFSHETAITGATSASFKNVDAIYLYFSNSIAYVQDVLEKVGGIQIEKGSTATALEPYISQSLAFTLPTEHPYLAKLPGGTADEIVVDREGNVELVARVSKATIDASRFVEWGKGKLAINFPSDGKFNSGPFNEKDVICQMLKSENAKKLYEGTAVGITVGSPFSHIDKCDTSLFLGDGVDMSIIDGTPFYYPLMTEKRYPLGKIEMPNVRDSIMNMWTDAEITPMTAIEYMRDVNIVVENLESAIASITEG